MRPICRQALPNWVALRSPVHAEGSAGGCQRSAATGCCDHSSQQSGTPAQTPGKMDHICLLRGFQEWVAPLERITLAAGPDLGADCVNARPAAHYRNDTKTVT